MALSLLTGFDSERNHSRPLPPSHKFPPGWARRFSHPPSRTPTSTKESFEEMSRTGRI